MDPEEESAVANLVTSTFQHDVAPHYSREGIHAFLAYADPSAIKDRQERNHVVLVAFQDDESIVGIIELRDFSHVSMLFVEPTHQRKGVGRQLLNEAVQLMRMYHPELHEVTVNSSPNSVEAYKRFGFRATDELQIKNGIKFVPMTRTLDA